MIDHGAYIHARDAGMLEVSEYLQSILSSQQHQNFQPTTASPYKPFSISQKSKSTPSDHSDSSHVFTMKPPDSMYNLNTVPPLPPSIPSDNSNSHRSYNNKSRSSNTTNDYTEAVRLHGITKREEHDFNEFQQQREKLNYFWIVEKKGNLRING